MIFLLTLTMTYKMMRMMILMTVKMVLLSCSKTDEEYVVSKKNRYIEFTEQITKEIQKLEIGLKCPNFNQFKRVAKEYAIRQRVDFKFRPITNCGAKLIARGWMRF